MATEPTTAKGDLRLLDPKRTHVRRDEFDRLQMEIGFEERYGPVRAFRCLPLTRPEEFISIQLDEGEEVGVIPDLRELDPDSRRAVLDDLELYYLKAEVREIKSVESKNGIISWELETDLGSKRVHIRDRSHIRPLLNGKTILTDIHGAKYEIPPLDQLDEKSRDCLETEL